MPRRSGCTASTAQAVLTFTLVATAQIGWGVLSLIVRSRWFVLLGALTNAAIVGGWALAKTSGISFIDGLEASEGAQLADSIAAGLAAVAVVGALVAVAARFRAYPIGHTVIGAFALVTALVTSRPWCRRESHTHAGGRGGTSHGTGAGGAGGDHGHGSSVAPVPYDPTKPIDLGGVDGVTPEQQARAENLIVITLVRASPASPIRQWRRRRVSARSATLRPATSTTSTSTTSTTAAPSTPTIPSRSSTSLKDGTKKLEAAMYMLAPDQTLEQVPDVGGKLTQWHIHNNPCSASANSCPQSFFPVVPEPMMHVWILPNRCGPFAGARGRERGPRPRR